jgi:exosortase K
MRIALSKPLLQLVLLWGLVLGGKCWYQQATAAELMFLLKPTAWGTQLLSGHHFTSTSEKGLLSAQGSILISKDCSGFNFLLIALLAGGFALLPGRGNQLWLLPASLLLAYGLTLLGNVMRICCLLFLNQAMPVPHWLHLAVGIGVYLCLLLPYSLLLSKTTSLQLSYAN